jgi:phosphatidylserine/phosphatidylglycerophosphate/cardiolipin synthase-like enzyme
MSSYRLARLFLGPRPMRWSMCIDESAVMQWQPDESGGHGVLHVKCAAADGRWLFLSSANLTANAFSVNMELGLLVGGGPLPGQVDGLFGRLIAAGVLAEIG